MLNVIGIQESFVHEIQKMAKGIHNDFLSGLSKTAVAAMSQGRGDISMLQGPITDYNNLWVHGGSRVLR